MEENSPGSAALFEEAPSWEAYGDNRYLQERTQIVRSMLPAQARTLLDVGCGNGLLLRSLAADHAVVGCDPSVPALRSFREPRVCAIGQRLPFRNAAFDLVSCLEVLEHLHDAALAACARELARVSRRWLLVATPDGEDPRRNSLHCPSCGCIFNRSHHLQRLDFDSLLRLFPDFAAADRRSGGQPVRPYPRPLLWLRHRLARRFYKGPGETRSLCPSCGNREFPPFRPNPLSVLLDGCNRIISRRRPYWILLLLERQPGGSIGSAR